jgi:energy-coupling factor transport system permease protein
VSVFYVTSPFVLFALLLFAVLQNMLLDKGKRLFSNLAIYIFIALVIFLFNPLFSHRGEVVLTYMFGNPITLESVVYGLKSALSLLVVLFMFSAFNITINPEKFMYLFSRIAEQTAFVIMLGLRFIPTLKRRLSEISDVSKISGTKVSFIKKTKNAANQIMTLISWSLEDAVVTAQSMRSRGYGANIKLNKGKTFYFLYKFTKKDALFVFLNAAFFVLFLFTHIAYDLDFMINPAFSDIGAMFSFKSAVNFLFLAIQFNLPAFAEIINNIKWSLIYNAGNRI